MKTIKEYETILETTINYIEQYFPNWRMIQTKESFGSMFARCLPRPLSYEDVAILCFMFHRIAKL